MSGPASYLPPEIGELMTLTVSWEKTTGVDGYGQQTFAAAKSKSCWIEQRSYLEGFEMNRGADEWPIVPTLTLYFDGSDTDARTFTLNDRFTLTNYPTDTPISQKMQPSQINYFFGPNYDNTYPWLVEVNMSLA